MKLASALAFALVAACSTSGGDANDAGKQADSQGAVSPNCPFDPPTVLRGCATVAGKACVYGSPCVEWYCVSGYWCANNVCDSAAPGEPTCDAVDASSD